MMRRRDAPLALLRFGPKDRQFGERLAEAVRDAANNVDAVWYSASHMVEASSEENQELRARRFFFLVLTPSALEDKPLIEQTLDAKQFRKNIVLILLRPVRPVRLSEKLMEIGDDAPAVSALPGTPLSTVAEQLAGTLRGEQLDKNVKVADLLKADVRRRRSQVYTPIGLAFLLVAIICALIAPTAVAHAKPLLAGDYGCGMPLRLNLGPIGGAQEIGHGQWWPAGSLQLGRAGASAITLGNGDVLVEGGAIIGDFTRTSELFDPRTCAWRSSGTLHFGRTVDAAVRLPNGKVLAVGGYDGPVLTDAELYNPATGTWSPTGSMVQARDSMTATVLHDGRVLVVGGWDNTVAASAEIYDPATGRWSSAGDMSIPRTSQIAALLPSGKVLIAGGEPVNVSYTDRAELYDPATNTWTETGSMTLPRAAAGAVTLLDGRVFVAGGDSTTGLTETSEIYDPATGTWSAAASMHYPRSLGRGMLVLLPSGNVMAIGGDNLGTSEIYLPGSNTWTDPVSLGGPRCDASATVLNDGRVLMVAGDNCQGEDTRPTMAEIYTA